MGRKLQTQTLKPHTAFGRRMGEAIANMNWPKMNQDQLGRKLTGVTGSTVNNWLNGKKLPSTEAAIELSIILGVSLDWLLVGRGSMEFPQIKENIVYIGNVPQESQEAIKGLIASFDKNPPSSETQQ